MIPFLSAEQARVAGLRGAMRKRRRRGERPDVVLALLADGRRMTITEIIAATGFPRTSTCTVLRRLRDKGLVRPCGFRACMTRGGRSEEQLFELGREINRPAPRRHALPHAKPAAARKSSGSGQIAAPVYYRGLAGFGGWRGKF